MRFLALLLQSEKATCPENQPVLDEGKVAWSESGASHMSASSTTSLVRSRRRSLAAPARRNLFFEGLEDRRVFATGMVAFSNAAYTYTEGSGGGNFTGQLIYSGETTTNAGTATVGFTANSATAADVTLDPVVVNIPAGITTGQAIDFSVAVENDTLLEGDESFDASITAVVAGAGDTITASGITSASITISDNETASLNFDNTTLSVNEADGTINVIANLVITANGVANTGTLANDLTVNFTSDASANLTINPVVIPAGTASGQIQIPITIDDDTDFEGDLTYNVSVDTVVGGGNVSGGNSLAVTVLDNDVEVTLPSVEITGAANAKVGQEVNLTLVTTDTQADMDAGFTYNVNWGDGTIETLSGAAVFNVSHTYTTTGNFQVTVTATDQNSDVSATVNKNINVTSAAFVIVNGQVRVNAGAGNDRIIVAATNDGRFLVRLNGELLGRFSQNRLLIRAGDGNDAVIFRGTVANDIGVRATVLGGRGNDVINVSGNLGGNIVVGGPGNDVLIGSLGRDILIGGAGRDVLRGLSGEDVLVGGGVRFGANINALDTVLAQWMGSGNFRARVNTIRTGPGPNINLNTHINDSARETIFGGLGADLLLAGRVDVTDFVRGDILARARV